MEDMRFPCQAAVENSAWNRLLNDPFGKGTLLAVPFLGLLLGMLLLVKINFYFFGLFLFMYLLWRLFYLHTILDRPAIIRGIAVFLVAHWIIMVHLLFQGVFVPAG